MQQASQPARTQALALLQVADVPLADEGALAVVVAPQPLVRPDCKTESKTESERALAKASSKAAMRRSSAPCATAKSMVSMAWLRLKSEPSVAE
jgi:hypothetical protein